MLIRSILAFSLCSLSFEGTAHSFLNFCDEKKSQPGEIQKTVQALLNLAETASCEEAFQDLSKRTTLDLSHQNISSLWPLKDFRPVALILENNQIKDLWPISQMKSLLILNLKQNLVEDVIALSFLEELQNLDISHNQIGNLNPLKDLSNLKDISWEKNPPLDEQGEEFVQRIEDSLQSLIWFRKSSYRFQHPEIKDVADGAETFNLASDRGDMVYFRYLAGLSKAETQLIFSQMTYSSPLLTLQSKKFLLAVQHAARLAEDILVLSQNALSPKYSSFLEAKGPELIRVLEHFIAEEDSIPYSRGDVTLLEKYLKETLAQKKHQGESILAQFVMPHIFTQHLNLWRKKYAAGLVPLSLETGLGLEFEQ
jgi:hypothetical protein